jgi:hypothetical protein
MKNELVYQLHGSAAGSDIRLKYSQGELTVDSKELLVEGHREWREGDLTVEDTRIGKIITAVVIPITRAGLHTELSLLLPSGSPEDTSEFTAVAVMTNVRTIQADSPPIREGYTIYPLVGSATPNPANAG